MSARDDRRPAGLREGGLEGQPPLRARGVQQPDLGRRAAARRPRDPACGEVGPEPAQLGVDPAGLLVMRQDADPVGLGTEVVGVPVPVLDHLRAPGDERPRGLPPLPVVGGEVRRRPADGAGVGLGDQERRLLGGVHPVRAERTGSRPRTSSSPAADRVVRHRESVLHGVVRVTGGHVERPGQVGVVDGRPLVGDAGGDELVVPGVLAGDAGLPGDELGGQLGLERTPGEVVLRLPVAVRASTGRPRCSACATSRPAPTPR